MKTAMSIVVPCLNEEEAIPIFYKAITPVLNNLNCDYELIFVDDGSTDNTSKIIKELAEANNKVKYIILSRNFGKESAMYAGFKNCQNEYVGIMDVDLQDPVEKLVEMYEILESDSSIDCVATRRVTRKGEPPIRSFFARKFYKVINRWTEVEIVDGARDFRLMRRQMANAVVMFKEKNRFSKGLFSYVGFNTKWLEYENVERCAGVTKWNFKKLFFYAIEGIVSFTIEPLVFIFKMGLFFNIIDFVALITLIVLECVGVHVFYQFVIILLAMVFMFGTLLASLGVMSIYLAKSYTEVKDRPIYVEKENNIK